MNKTAIKNFAIWARNKLMEDIAYELRLLGITEKGIGKKLPQSAGNTEFYDIGTRVPYEISGEAVRQRQELVGCIEKKTQEEDYSEAYQSLVEEVAYTWFNRLIAIRFMEVNDYLPGRLRVLSSGSANKLEPELVTTPLEGDLEFTAEEREQIGLWQEENRMDALFRLLFIKECNALNESLPALFERTKDYTELLLNLSVTDPDGVVYHLVHDVPEEDFNIEAGGQVEIIGWLYQYYNTEPKDKVFANLKKNIKISKDNIPAATQLFTPDWIVRYMVENSLGRLWIGKKLGEGKRLDGALPLDGSYTMCPEWTAEEQEAYERDFAARMGWQYYLPEAREEEAVYAELAKLQEEYRQLELEKIKIIDPCMGSGHILVYAFEVLMQLYLSQGYDERDAAESILMHNLYGLDIDDRAFQLAYFSLFMKARQYNRRILKKDIELHIAAIQESNGLQKWDEVSGNAMVTMQLDFEHQFIDQIDDLIDSFHDAKEYGSLLTVKKQDFASLLESVKQVQAEGTTNLMLASWLAALDRQLRPLVQQAKILSQRYDVVVTNPPYMGGSGMSAKLSAYVKENFPDYKSDLFSACMVRFTYLAKENGYLGFLSPYVWMFITSYEKLRKYFIEQKTIETLIQFEYSAFEEATVPICTFAFRNCHVDKKGCYLRLTEYRGGMEVQRQKALEAIATHDKKMYFEANAKNFAKIPGTPIAYWASEKIYRAFQVGNGLGGIANPKKGLATTDNNRFLRLWYEVALDKIGIGYKNNFLAQCSKKKWFPLNKGGAFRRWYGNKEYMVNWYHDGYEMKDAIVKRYHGGSYTKEIRSENKYFQDSITWSALTAGKSSFRFSDYGALFDSAGSSMFSEKHQYIIALLNVKVVDYILKMINPTLNYGAGAISAIPIIQNEANYDRIIYLSKENIAISKQDWDSFETSWDFRFHPLLAAGSNPSSVEAGTLNQSPALLRADKEIRLAAAYADFQQACEERFTQLKANEEELNRVFIDIYGLQEELTPEVADKDVTVARIYDTKEGISDSMKGNSYVLTKADVVKSLLSYAVGCMFGRYSLDMAGLVFAGGTFDMSNYTAFQPDEDNVLPVTDEDYFYDDIVGRFVEWMKAAFGKENLEENLAFIADALGTNGTGSRDSIRTYFLKDFYKDHVRTYKKRPIYWLYDSGRKNGFKALIYMHRYDADTTGRVRIDYLHRMERTYETEIQRMTSDIDHDDNAREIAKATKRRDKLQKQLKECQEYDEQISAPALARINIDLDDGVKVNYEKAQTVKDKTYQMLAKI